MLEKLSSAQLNQYLIKSASALRTLQSENEELRTQLAQHERRDQAEKIARLAVERGVVADDDHDSYAEKLASSTDDLKMVEEFVGRASTSLGLGRPMEKVAAEGEEGSGEQDVLTTFLLGSDLAR